MVWNAVAAIGGSLISGIFGSKKKKEETITDQTSSSTIDYKGLADAAIAGGFNPLTAIRTGGASGFVTTRTTGKNVTTSSGGGGVGAAIGDAIASAGASGLFGSFNTPKNDPIRVKSKTSGAVSSLVRSQLPGASRAPALNVQPTQRMQRSPVTSRPPLKGFIGPPTPKQFVKDNGGMDLYVPYYDRSTRQVLWGPNPDIPDLDQMLTPPAIAVPNKIAEKAKPLAAWSWPNPLLPMRYPKPERKLRSGGW